MNDLKELHAHPERMRETIRLRRFDPVRANLDRWLKLDEQTL